MEPARHEIGRLNFFLAEFVKNRKNNNKIILHLDDSASTTIFVGLRFSFVGVVVVVIVVDVVGVVGMVIVVGSEFFSYYKSCEKFWCFVFLQLKHFR